MAALAARVEVVAVSVLGWTLSLLRSGKAFLFPLADVPDAGGFEPRMSRSGKRLACGHRWALRNGGLPGQFTGGEVLTLLSIFCQRFSRLCKNCSPRFS